MAITNSERVKEILSWYPALTNAQIGNLERIIFYGRIGGSGKFVILPVDQGFEHGPDRSFLTNPEGYDPVYHAQLAIDAWCNAHAAPLGALEAAQEVIKKGNLPTILKVNSHDLMMPGTDDPFPAITSWVNDAVRLGCAAVGFSIYPGSKYSREMYQEVKELAKDARKAGLVVVIWAYPRGSGLPPLIEMSNATKEDIEVAVDVVSYGVHIASQLGAHIIKCKPTKPLIALPSHRKRKIFEGIPIETLADRTRLVVRAAFGGHRIVIISGGEAKTTEELLGEVRQIKAGGAFGSIVGRNSFQRPKEEAIKLLHLIQDIYAGVD